MIRKIRFRNVALVSAMARQGFNNRRLACATGLSMLTISSLVNQRHDPKPETAAKIARVLRVPAAKLFPHADSEVA